MRNRRAVRIALVLVCLLAGSLGPQVWAALSVPVASANVPSVGTVDVVPVRWCLLNETDTAGPGVDSNMILWNRHERPTDRAYTTQARISFRSGFEWNHAQVSGFPRFSDPLIGGIGQAGAVLDADVEDPRYVSHPDDQDPNFAGKAKGFEFRVIRNQCEAAWRGINAAAATANVGITTVNIREFVDVNGNPMTTRHGQASQGWFGGPAGVSFQTLACTDPSQLTMVRGTSVLVVDVLNNSFLNSTVGGVPFRNDGAMMAHEFGHALGLEHGDGIDNNGNGRFDGYPPSAGCDPNEPLVGPGRDPTVMNPDVGVGTYRLEPLQVSWVRAWAKKYSGGVIDPPAAILPGQVVADLGTDPFDDVPTASVDLTTASIAVNQTANAVNVSHEVFGLIPNVDDPKQYLLFLDTDNDPTTGGRPEELGLPTIIEGIELVTRVEVRGGKADPTVWIFDGKAFVEFDDVRRVTADVRDINASESQVPLFSVVSLGLPLNVIGSVPDQVRFQAAAEHMGAVKQLDVMPGGPGSGPSPASEPWAPVAPDYPVCAITPDQVDPGDTVTLEATGFRRPNEGVHALLGDQPIANGTLDDQDTVITDFTVPSDAEPGLRLVTVGVDGTALTADCYVQVGKVVPLPPDPWE